MARLNKQRLLDEDGDEEIKVRTPTTRQHADDRPQGELSPSPAASFSSDKENRGTPLNRTDSSKSMAPPRLPTPHSPKTSTLHTSKRRRLGERDVPNASQAAYQRELDYVADTQYYDPEQPPEERRAVRQGIRDLARELTDSKSEYMSADSNGLADTLKKANDLFSGVKQTSDATLDSRLLVTAGDLSARRSAQMKLGDASQGVNVDEFVAKCIAFMRKGPTDAEAAFSSSTQRSRKRRSGNDEGSGPEADDDDGDAHNWEWLGRKACFPHNLRPPTPGFLLGPLSVQKRTRKQTQRRERLRRQDPKDAVRPDELKATDLQRVENSNLTTLCKNILELLVQKQADGEAQLQAEYQEDMSNEELQVVLRRSGLADNGAIPLFRFVINPKSFGQTVENLFYISFLIRDGRLSIETDSNQLPTLRPSQPRSKEEIRGQKISKHQAVFHLDYDTWDDLIDSFEIETCDIPHRGSDGSVQVAVSGWYG